MQNPPWDQRIARILVKPLVTSPVTPNQSPSSRRSWRSSAPACWRTAALSMFIDLDLDKHLPEKTGKDAVGYPGFAGFELEDGIYLLAPITWPGYSTPFFVLTAAGSVVYFLWSCWRLLRLKRR